MFIRFIPSSRKPLAHFTINKTSDSSQTKTKSSLAMLSCWSLLSAYSVQAEDLGFTEESLYSDIPIVLTASRLKQSIAKTPVATSVIDRKMIEASGAINIPELLRLVPGFVVSRPRGGTYAVAYHGATGSDPRRLEVQVNGRSVYQPAQSSVTWSTIGVTIDEIERIEVVRGPSSPAHGSNAFKGVINIVTREPFLDSGTTFSGEYGLDAEHHRRHVSHADSFGDFDYRVSAQYYKNQGFDAEDDDVEMASISFRGTYQPSPDDTIDIQLGYNTGPEGLSSNGTSTNPYRDRDLISHYQNLSWNRVIDEDEEIGINFYHNYHKENDLYSLGMATDVLAGGSALALATFYGGQQEQELFHGVYNYTIERFDLEMEHTLSPTESSRLVWGMGIRQDRLKGKYLLSHDGFIEDVSERLFANYEWNLSKKTALNLGAMLEHNDTNSTSFSPRIALNHELHKNHAIRISATQGYRTLSLLEANFNYANLFEDGTQINRLIVTPNPVEKEKITAYELGFIGRIPEIDTTYDVKLFSEHISNGIAQHIDSTYADPWPAPAIQNGARLVDNDSEIDVRGIELELRWEPNDRTFATLHYGYSDTDAWRNRNNSSFESLNTGVPDHNYGLLVSHTLDNQVQLSSVVSYVDEIDWIGGDLIPGHTRVDVRIAKKFKFASHSAEIAFLAQNLMEDYEEFELRNVFGEKYYIQARLDFH